jgi:myo-inositol 2-dehydrogenase / D-chiro-inositol 1-dehydrogenase
MKIGFVGTGGVAERHLRVLRDVPGLELVGHVSAERARSEAQARRWGGRAYTDLEHLLEREQPEAGWVCVTPDRHGRLEESLIERGVHFFVEKPLARDLPTAERIASRLEQQPLVVAVGYKFRALDTLATTRRLLEERPALMVLGAWHDRTPAPAWWQDASRSGGQIVEQATHLVDLARVLLGDPEVVSALARRVPRAAFPASSVDEVTAALLRFPGAIPGTLTATCLLEGNLAAHLQLVCEGRILTLVESALRVDTGRDTHELRSTVDPFLVEDTVFLEAARGGDRGGVLCDYADALATHRICAAIRDRSISLSG